MSERWEAAGAAIAAATGSSFDVTKATPLSGGDINRAFRLEGASSTYFIKLNSPRRLPMFEAEADALAALRNSASVRVPEPICTGSDAQHSWLALEYVAWGASTPGTEDELGAQLAALHRSTARQFGWHRDNTIGSTPQLNYLSDSWPNFFATYRLGYQLELAGTNGGPARLLASGEQLMDSLSAFFSAYQPTPSLLHGDLWGGNWAADRQGLPVLYDPASYYGDREADLAMTELFGGFSDRFYQSYMNAWAIDPGYQTRKVLYNLYHVLNHFNLFGGGYAQQAQDMIERLLAEVS